MEMTHPSGTLGVAPTEAAAAAVARGVAGGLGAAGSASEAAGSGSIQLADLATGAEARVVSVAALDSSGPTPGGSAELGRRLAELGFLPGERLRIVARGLVGREPIAVRIGTGTFALRLFEAACIRVAPEHSLLR